MLDCGGFPKLTTLEMLVSEVLPALTNLKPSNGAGQPRLQPTRFAVLRRAAERDC